MNFEIKLETTLWGFCDEEFCVGDAQTAIRAFPNLSPLPIHFTQICFTGFLGLYLVPVNSERGVPKILKFILN